MSADPGTRARAWLPPLLVAACVALVFARTVGHEFLLWDDDIGVTRNARLIPASLSSALSFWREPFLGLYVPVSFSFYSLEAWVSQRLFAPDDLHPAVFHAGNLGLAIAGALAAWDLLRLLTGDARAAAIGALAFALHPLQVEAASWVTETRGLLATAFALLALGQWVRLAAPHAGERAAAGAARAGAARAVACLLLFALSLLSKPSAVAAPVMALAIAALLPRRPGRAALGVLAAWLLLAAAAVWLTRGLQPVETAAGVVPLGSRPWVALDALGFYVRKLIVPLDLVPDYGRTPSVVLAGTGASWHGLLLVALLVACGFSRRRRLAFASLGVFVAGLLPVLGLVPFRHQIYSTVADRYAALALIGPAIAVAGFLADPWRLRRTLVFAPVLLAWAGMSIVQAGRWRDTETIFRHVLTVNPRSWPAHNNLGIVLDERGEHERAIEHYRDAIWLRPDDPLSAKAHNNLALVYDAQGSLDAALGHYGRALELQPDYALAHANRAELLTRVGRLPEAVDHYREALRLAPDFYPASENLGLVLYRLERVDEAIAVLEELARRAPDYATGRFVLVQILLRVGRDAEALPHLRAVVEAAPDLQEARALLEELEGSPR